MDRPETTVQHLVNMFNLQTETIAAYKTIHGLTTRLEKLEQAIVDLQKKLEKSPVAEDIN